MQHLELSAVMSLLILFCPQTSPTVSSELVDSEPGEIAKELGAKPAEDAKSRSILPQFFNFDRFKTIFDKSYGSMIEELIRKRLFLVKAFRAFISAVGYKYGTRSSYLAINAMSDWTPDEIKRLYSGGRRISNKIGGSLDGTGDENEEVHSESEKVIQAINEVEILEIISKIDENSDVPGYTEIIRELKSVTSRRVKREDIRDFSMNNLLEEPIKVEPVSSDRIPSNNPNYKAPELRSLGIKKQGGKERSISKKLADKIFKSNGLKFAANLIESFTSKFKSSKKKTLEPVAPQQQEVRADQDETHYYKKEPREEQHEAELNAVAQDQSMIREHSTGRSVENNPLTGQPILETKVQPPDSMLQTNDQNTFQADFLRIRDKLNLIVESIGKQLEYYEMGRNRRLANKSNHNQEVSPNHVQQNLPANEKEKRIEGQIAELQRTLQMLKMASDNSEKLAAADRLNIAKPVTSNLPVPHLSNNATLDTIQTVNGYAYNRVEKQPDQVFIDHRASNCFFPPRDQGFCGACYAFATIALYEYVYCLTTGSKVAFSEQYVVDCGEVVGMRGCSGGSYTYIPSFVNRFGLELRENYPYTQIEDYCPYSSEQVANNPQSMGYIRINEQSFANIHPAYVDYFLTIGPVVADIMVNSEFSEYGGGVDSIRDCDRHSFHAVLIVGSGREDDQEYWLIRNSNGVSWGEKGYYKMSKLSPCVVPEDFYILGLNFDSKYTKNENDKYDEQLIKERYGSKFAPDFDGVESIRAELLNLMMKLREMIGSKG